MQDHSKIDESRVPSKRKKTGGRKKGTPNATTKAIREAISAADPISFLVQVMQGQLPRPDGSDPLPEQEDAPSSGDRLRAAEFLARRIAPEAKERAITFEVGKISSPTDAMDAISSVANALSIGELLPYEAKALNGAIGEYLKAYETIELAERLDAIEAALASSGSR